MDINNYSYAPTIGNEKEQIFHSFEDENGYYKMTLEQWGSDRLKPEIVVYATAYNGDFDICENFTADKSCGWESMRKTYEKAARLFNQYCPESIPLF